MARAPYVLRRQLLIGFIVFPLGFATILCWALGYDRFVPYLAIPTIVIGVACAVWYLIFERRLNTHIDRFRALCPECSYPLRPEMKHCPECGEEVDYEQAVARWGRVDEISRS